VDKKANFVFKAHPQEKTMSAFLRKDAIRPFGRLVHHHYTFLYLLKYALQIE